VLTNPLLISLRKPLSTSSRTISPRRYVLLKTVNKCLQLDLIIHPVRKRWQCCQFLSCIWLELTNIFWRWHTCRYIGYCITQNTLSRWSNWTVKTAFNQLQVWQFTTQVVSIFSLSNYSTLVTDSSCIASLLRTLIIFSASLWASLSAASDFFPCVNKLISEEWQQSWDNCVGNKLRFIRPTVGTYLRNTSFCRRNIVIINNYLLVTLAVSPHAFLFVGRRTPAWMCDLWMSTYCQAHSYWM